MEASRPDRLLADRLLADGLVNDDDLASVDRDVLPEIDAAMAFAEAGTEEPVDDLLRFVHTTVADVEVRAP